MIASKFVIKAMANKFSPVYSSLEEMEIISTRRECRIDAVKSSRLFKYYVTSRKEKSMIHRSTYPLAFWHSYEVFFLQLSYVKNMHDCDNNDNAKLIVADFLYESFQYRQDVISFYMDGSKSEEGATGTAVFSPEMDGTIRHKLPSETSVFSAELWAIYQAILAILDLNISKSVIFSNSESALEALYNPIKKHRNYII